MMDKNVMNKKIAQITASLIFLLSFIGMNSVFAGQIKSVEWRSKGKEPVLSVKTSSRVASFETRSFEGGKRLRVIVNDTNLGTSILDLEGSGIVKGVFPYLTATVRRQILIF